MVGVEIKMISRRRLIQGFTDHGEEYGFNLCVFRSLGNEIK